MKKNREPVEKKADPRVLSKATHHYTAIAENDYFYDAIDDRNHKKNVFKKFFDFDDSKNMDYFIQLEIYWRKQKDRQRKIDEKSRAMGEARRLHNE